MGLLLIVSAFVPLGPYHFVGEADITGVLWNFMLPTGWLALIFGVVLLFHMRLGIKDMRLAMFILFASGSTIVFRIQDVDYFLSLWHGVNGNFDVDRHAVSIFPFVVKILGLIAYFFVIILQIPTENKLLLTI
jgi:hypothetical protein